MNAEKERLLAGVRAWLENLDEEPRQEAPASQEPDLFSLHVALGGLKTEVRHEARHFKNALDQFRMLFDELQHANAQLQTEIGEQRAREEQHRHETEREMLLELLDLRDRLHDAWNHARRYQPGWLARRSEAPAFVSGLTEGVYLNLLRLDEILQRREVQPIQTVGQPFDPLVMKAIDLVADASRPTNLVVSESRAGYRRGNRLLRPAEVIVNRHPEPQPSTSD